MRTQFFRIAPVVPPDGARDRPVGKRKRNMTAIGPDRPDIGERNILKAEDRFRIPLSKRFKA